MRSPRPVLTQQQRSRQRAAGASTRQAGSNQPYQNPTSSPLAFLAACQQVGDAICLLGSNRAGRVCSNARGGAYVQTCSEQASDLQTSGGWLRRMTFRDHVHRVSHAAPAYTYSTRRACPEAQKLFTRRVECLVCSVQHMLASLKVCCPSKVERGHLPASKITQPPALKHRLTGSTTARSGT